MIYVIAGIAFGLLVTAGGWLASTGEISTGELVTFLLISTRMTMPMFIFGILINQLQRGEAAAKRVFATIDLEPTIFDELSCFFVFLNIKTDNFHCTVVSFGSTC